MIIALQGAKEFRFRPIRTFLEFNIVKIQNYFKFHPILEILNSNSESKSLIAHFQPRSIHFLIQQIAPPSICDPSNIPNPIQRRPETISSRTKKRGSIPCAERDEGMKKETPSHSRLITVERSHVAAHICL